MRPVRFIPVLFGLVAAAYLIGDGKAYYLASLYPTVIGSGSIPTAAWLTHGAHQRVRAVSLGLAVALSAIVSAVVALPVLPERDLPGSAAIALNPDLGETVGWPQFISTVSTAWHSLPTTTRSHAVIFTRKLRRGRSDRRSGLARPAPTRLLRPQRLQPLGQTAPRSNDHHRRRLPLNSSGQTVLHRLPYRRAHQQSSAPEQRRIRRPRPQMLRTHSTLDANLAATPPLRLTRKKKLARCQVIKRGWSVPATPTQSADSAHPKTSPKRPCSSPPTTPNGSAASPSTSPADPSSCKRHMVLAARW